MSRVAFVICFFRVVPPVRAWITGAFLVTVGISGTLLALRITGPGEALAPVFLLHTLAASSGFAAHARRGHYDLLLTSGESRLRIGVAHWAASIAPGVIGWVAIVAIEAIIDGGGPLVSLSTGTVVAMWLISALSWGATVALPRMAVGIVWLLVAVLTHGVTEQQSHLWRIFLPLALPSTLVGANLGLSDIGTIIPALLIATATGGWGLSWIYRTDIPLQVAR